jgi:predicted secreted hydrolase
VRFVIPLVLVLLLVLVLTMNPEPPAQPQSIRLAPVGTSQPFARAFEPVELTFPPDHGPHHDFQTEWWYFTGNLAAESGDHFGYQLTIFRRGLAPGTATRESAYAANHIYFGHLALTDVSRGRHLAYEQSSRGAAGFAGADGDPFRVYLEGWRVEAGDAATSEIRLRASVAELAVDLVLKPGKPIVLHGEGGLSPKSEQPGNASYYVSFTRMVTSGMITIEGSAFSVDGQSWFDHEWGTSALGPEAVGWDWFGLQLDDGRELMLFQIRRQDGGFDPASGGTIVYADGSSRPLAAQEFDLEPRRRWSSDASGAVYPVAWRIEIPSERLELSVQPWLDAQENDLGIVYWEGAVRVSGSATGVGYLELTGYKDPLTELY